MSSSTNSKEDAERFVKLEKDMEYMKLKVDEMSRTMNSVDHKLDAFIASANQNFVSKKNFEELDTRIKILENTALRNRISSARVGAYLVCGSFAGGLLVEIIFRYVVPKIWGH